MVPSVRPDPSSLGGWLALTLGLGGVLWLVVSLWPGLGAPAWPAVSLGALAMILGLGGRGRPVLRGLGGALGLCALIGGALQIGAIWGAAELLQATER